MRMAEVSSTLAFLLRRKETDQPEGLMAFKEGREGCLADVMDNGG